MGAGASAKPNIGTKDAKFTSNVDRQDEDNDMCGLAVVVAIDFGTCYSGYAFSFKGSRNVINTQTHGGRLPEDRVPTVILLNPDQMFNSYGYDAIKTYINLPEKEQRDYFYFEHFKMSLYETLRSETQVNSHSLDLRVIKELGLRDMEELDQFPFDQWPEYLQKYYHSNNENTTQSHSLKIKDILKKEIDAQKIFSLSIQYFRNLAVEAVDLSTLGLKEEYIQWMISIPAIWSDSAKQFMRQAAEDAGIRPENLRFVLEPEAASLYCDDDAVMASGNTLDPLLVGHKYILADLGGGTADICVHEVMGEGRLRELYRATGGDFGGNTVNKEFELFMSNIVGCEVWNDFKSKHLAFYYDFMKCFETKKREFRMDATKIIIRLEPSLISVCETGPYETFTSMVSKSKRSTSVEYKTKLGKLSINRSVMEQFFDHSLSGIIQTLSRILRSCKTDNIKTLLLVGGYADSLYVRQKFQEAFPNFRVMLPPDSRLAVLKGAVIMGYKPREVVERRARFTYGFDYSEVFIPGKHPKKLRRIHDGLEMCSGMFRKMIEKNQVVKYGETFTWEGYNIPIDQDFKHIEKHIALFRSCISNPLYCLDKEGSELLDLEDQACEKVGEIVIEPPPEGWHDNWAEVTQIIVGETELIVKHINKKTGQEYKANIHFL